jgi:hypothetical protein
MGHKMLRDYLFVDREKIRRLSGQLQPLEREVEQTSAKLGISLAGPKLETTSSSRVRPTTLHEEIETLTDHLEATGSLGRERPLRMPMSRAGETEQIPRIPNFILENTTATKVIIPPELSREVPGIREFAIWVSEPDVGFELERNHEWDFTGTFLYLTHLEWADDRLTTVYSGCSALQVISNAISGRPVLSTHPSGHELLGRDSHDHPLMKLRSIGGIVSLKKEIECLYRPKYITDEQVFEVDGKPTRVNDLLAYPIFIAELV